MWPRLSSSLDHFSSSSKVKIWFRSFRFDGSRLSAKSNEFLAANHVDDCQSSWPNSFAVDSSRRSSIVQRSKWIESRRDETKRKAKMFRLDIPFFAESHSLKRNISQVDPHLQSTPPNVKRSLSKTNSHQTGSTTCSPLLGKNFRSVAFRWWRWRWWRRRFEFYLSNSEKQTGRSSASGSAHRSWTKASKCHSCRGKCRFIFSRAFRFRFVERLWWIAVSRAKQSSARSGQFTESE